MGFPSDEMAPGPILVLDIHIGEVMVGPRDRRLGMEPYSVLAGRLGLGHGAGLVFPSHSGLHHDQLSSGLSLETFINNWQSDP